MNLYGGDLIQPTGPKYAVTVTPCRFGWTASPNLAPGQLLTLVEVPVFWRRTREAAIRAAWRRVARWERQDARKTKTEIITKREAT